MFSGKNNDDVLLHMLFEYGIFEETENDTDVVLRNHGIRFLKILGGGEVSGDTIKTMLKALVRQTKKEKGECL
jgi:hypothetical protein